MTRLALIRRLFLAGVVAVLAATTATSAGSAAPRATAASGLWHGTAEGIQVRSGHKDFHTDPDTTADSSENYEVQLKFSFEVHKDGRISGTGNGSYDQLHWHLSGVNGDKGAFDCDVPVSGNDFPVVVGGFVSGSTAHLSLAIPDATETNQDYDCGADFTGYATTSHFMAESLDAVGGNDLTFGRSHPVIPTRTKEQDTSDSSETWQIQNTWSFKLTAPSGSGSGNGGGSGGGSGTPPSSGNPPSRSACTIIGTRHADVLRGTNGPDVICGLGGNDKIYGRGGNDKIYAGSGNDFIDPGSGKDFVAGGPGNDRIKAKDGSRDLIGGGPGHDTAKVDKHLDRVTGVEKVS